jgi:hypothetical protein
MAGRVVSVIGFSSAPPFVSGLRDARHGLIANQGKLFPGPLGDELIDVRATERKYRTSNSR